MRTKLIILITCAVAVMSGVLYFSYSKKTTTTTVAGTLLEFKKSDKIFTSFVYASTVDIKKELLKRDAALGFLHLKDSEDIKPVPVGTCSHEYEVGVGYDDINNIITSNLEAVCSTHNVALPDPKLLSINPTNSLIKGEYSRSECDEWITVVRGARRCDHTIKNQLVADGNWEIVAVKSKEILKSYIQIYCN